MPDALHQATATILQYGMLVDLHDLAEPDKADSARRIRQRHAVTGIPAMEDVSYPSPCHIVNGMQNIIGGSAKDVTSLILKNWGGFSADTSIGG